MLGSILQYHPKRPCPPPPPPPKQKTPDVSNVPPHHREADPLKHTDWSNPRKAARYLFLSLNAWNQIHKPNWETDFADTCQVGHVRLREKMPSWWRFSGCDDEGPQFINDGHGGKDDVTLFHSFFQFQLKKLLGVTVSLLKASSHQNMWTQRCAVTDKIEMPRGGSANDGSLIHFGLSDVTNMMQVLPRLPWRFVKCKYGVGTLCGKIVHLAKVTETCLKFKPLVAAIVYVGSCSRANQLDGWLFICVGWSQTNKITVGNRCVCKVKGFYLLAQSPKSTADQLESTTFNARLWKLQSVSSKVWWIFIRKGY